MSNRHWNGEEWVTDEEVYEGLAAAALAIQEYHNGDRAWAERWLLKALRASKPQEDESPDTEVAFS